MTIKEILQGQLLENINDGKPAITTYNEVALTQESLKQTAIALLVVVILALVAARIILK
jgi:hypothetical protein